MPSRPRHRAAVAPGSGNEADELDRFRTGVPELVQPIGFDVHDVARMELDGQLIPVARHQAIVIPPGVRHRAVGTMKVLIVVNPEFDPADEWFD